MDRAIRLVVIGDSFAFTDDRGPQLPDAAHLYPNVAAATLSERLETRVVTTVLARPGIGARDLWTALSKDRHVQFDVVARADAVVVAVGSFDHVPAGIPTPVRALVPYVRPAPVRRATRTVIHRLNPLLIRATGGHLPVTPTAEFRRLFDLSLLQIRGLATGAAGAVLGPAGQAAAHYARRNPHLVAREALQSEMAARHGFAFVPVRSVVAPFRPELNPDGIHWPAAAHEAVGRHLGDAVADQLTGRTPRPPSVWESGPRAARPQGAARRRA
jgi:diglucosylglycerate octanoyltransferase